MQNKQTTRKSALAVQVYIKDMNRQLKQLQKQSSISAARLSIIQYLLGNGPQGLTAIANYRGVSAATMSRLLAALVSKKLILRASSKKDRRRKIFLVTLKGKQLLAEENTQQINALQIIIEHLSDDEQLRLNQSVQLLQKVIGILNNPS